jgi:hypothetical protein
MMPPTTTEHRIGLRFNRNQARALHDLADRLIQHELPGEASVFVKAALAAESGEPLIIVCVKPIEAILIAKGYANYGITEPVIEQLA